MVLSHILLTLAGLLAGPASQGHAYLDPGSGSFILQLAIATLLGGLFVIKSYWNKIIGFFRKGDDKKEDDIEQ